MNLFSYLVNFRNKRLRKHIVLLLINNGWPNSPRYIDHEAELLIQYIKNGKTRSI